MYFIVIRSHSLRLTWEDLISPMSVLPGSVQRQKGTFFLWFLPMSWPHNRFWTPANSNLCCFGEVGGSLLSDKPVDFLHFCNQLRQSFLSAHSFSIWSFSRCFFYLTQYPKLVRVRKTTQLATVLVSVRVCSLRPSASIGVVEWGGVGGGAYIHSHHRPEAGKLRPRLHVAGGWSV